jgi:hypothetical protein
MGHVARINDVRIRHEIFFVISVENGSSSRHISMEEL